ncbi:MAG: DUF2007 domain-containing protein [Candidatus Latescibacteria bacterium]|nr:DUF2007 domain-containing protein [Candidatus Latescibacterota bacterium]
MFCPHCGYEIDRECSFCPKCKITFNHAIKPEYNEEHDDYITVFESGSPAVIVMAKSLLESADIRYIVKGENVHDLFGGHAAYEFNPVFGTTEIQVDEEDVEEALTILEDLEDTEYEGFDADNFDGDDLN